MIMFWVAAALLSAAAAGFIVFRAARAVRAAETAGEDPGLAVYRRQLGEIDALSDQGLILPDEQRSARAEAARRLLGAADQSAPATMSPKLDRRWIIPAAAIVPLIALGLYLAVGSPGAPDQPFAGRLADWRAADPASLDAAQTAAVLEKIVGEHPNAPLPLFVLARAQLAMGDMASAEHSARRALKLAPDRAELWGALGEVLVAESSDGHIPPEARQAFQHALKLDPTSAAPLYYLAHDKIDSGDAAGGLADLRALRAQLGADDPRRPTLDAEIASLETTGHLPVAQTQPANDGDQGAFIRAMVQRLAARLAASPDDPAGWARLIRSYQVLHDAPRRDAALNRARQLFKTRPDALRVIDAAADGSRP